MEIQKYYRKEPKFNGVYSRNNLPTIKDEAFVMNLDEYKSIGTHWIALYVNAENVTYFDGFGVENIPKDIRKFIGNKKIKPNIYTIQAHVDIFVLDLLISCQKIKFIKVYEYISS